jgi:hypothetical protein
VGVLTADTVAGLGAPDEDGVIGFVRLPSGHKEKLYWNIDQGAWIGLEHATMKQVQTTGMQSQGNPAFWKYPSQVEPLADPDRKAYGFEIHTQLDASEFWEAGLTLQENLVAEIRALAADVPPPSEMALAWFPLGDGASFLSPDSTNHGVHLKATKPYAATAEQFKYFWCSTGWQNSPAGAPPPGENQYPELYVMGNSVVFRNFSAKHRWVGGVLTGGAVSSEKASTYPDYPGVTSWHVADDIALANDAQVAEWADYSGYGRTLLQPAAGKRPILKKTGGPNGHAFVRFDGIDDIMKSLVQPYLVFDTGPITYFFVIAQRNSGGATQVWTSQIGGGAPLFYRDGADEIHWWGGGSGDLIGHVGSNWPMPFSVVTLRSDGANSKITRNGVVLATGDHGDASGNGLVIGNNSGETFPAAVDVAEVITSFGAPNDAKHDALVASLMAKYGIA